MFGLEFGYYSWYFNGILKFSSLSNVYAFKKKWTENDNEMLGMFDLQNYFIICRTLWLIYLHYMFVICSCEGQRKWISPIVCSQYFLWMEACTLIELPVWGNGFMKRHLFCSCRLQRWFVKWSAHIWHWCARWTVACSPADESQVWIEILPPPQDMYGIYIQIDIFW